jgi:hypothetical protein
MGAPEVTTIGNLNSAVYGYPFSYRFIMNMLAELGVGNCRERETAHEKITPDLYFN